MKPYITNFNIRVKSRDINTELFSTEGKVILDILSDTSLFSKHELEVCADPFLFVFDNKLFLFYEKQYTTLGMGYICMKSTSDLVNWTNEITVLKEDFHLSFPFVFKDDNDSVYMLPECSFDGSIRLYKADDTNLNKWSFVKYVKRDNNNWVDSSIIKQDGLYYLFTSDSLNGIQRQRLFIADNILGDFKEHKDSPIYCGNDYGRNAGSVISIYGDLYRPTQDCLLDYGKQVHIMKITKLSPSFYEEKIFKRNILDLSDPFYGYGGHHYNIVQFLNRVIYSTDAKVRNYNLFELFRRIINKVK